MEPDLKVWSSKGAPIKAYIDGNALLVSTNVRGYDFSVSPLLSVNIFIPTIEAFLDTLSLPGDVAEFGIAGGDTVKSMAQYLDHIQSSKLVWGFDSFQGIPPCTEMDGDEDGNWSEGNMVGWYKATVEAVENNLHPLTNYRLIKGMIQDTAPDFHMLLCFAHIDTDLYHGAHFALQACAANMCVGGKVVINDYHTHWHGVTRAVDGFLDSHKDWSMIDSQPGYAILNRGLSAGRGGVSKT